MKSLIVLSGGLDSTTALAHWGSIVGFDQIATLTFNYGSKHNARENEAAKKVANYYQVPNVLVTLPFIGETFKSDLLQSGGAIPEGHYEDPSMRRTVVPFRNGIMLSIAAGYAESIDAKCVVLGNHKGDHAIYPDCRKSFTDAMGSAIAQGTYSHVTLETPFGAMDKTQLLKMGLFLNTPYELTYSCYKGEERACGKCGTCNERLESFRKLGRTDPIRYEEGEKNGNV